MYVYVIVEGIGAYRWLRGSWRGVEVEESGLSD